MKQYEKQDHLYHLLYYRISSKGLKLSICRYMGTGPLCPNLLDGLKMVDLGCGYSRDTYAFAKLIGEKGHIVGVDITKKMVNCNIHLITKMKYN